MEETSVRQAKGFDQSSQCGGLISATGVVEEVSGEGRAPVPEDLNQAPLCDHVCQRLFHRGADSYTVEDCLDDQVRVVEGRGALGADGERFAALLELPPVEAVAEPEADAGVVFQVLRVARDGV